MQKCRERNTEGSFLSSCPGPVTWQHQVRLFWHLTSPSSKKEKKIKGLYSLLSKMPLSSNNWALYNWTLGKIVCILILHHFPSSWSSVQTVSFKNGPFKNAVSFWNRVAKQVDDKPGLVQCLFQCLHWVNVLYSGGMFSFFSLIIEKWKMWRIFVKWWCSTPPF